MSDIKKIIQKYLNGSLGVPKVNFKHLCYNCPICDAGGKHNLEILVEENTGTYIFNCWSCHFSGRIQKLLKEYACDSSWKVLKEFEYSKYKQEESKIINKPKVLFPEHTIPFYLNDATLKYLTEERRIDFITLTERNVRYCFHSENSFYNSILFPFYDEDKQVIGFCSQDMETKKYRNTGSLNFIAYKEFINPVFPIVITEGIYDALSVPNAIPLLGTNVNHAIYRFCQDKKIILALDNNEEVSIEFKKQIIKKLHVYGVKIATIFELEKYKDLNDFYCRDMPELKMQIKVMFELLNNIE